MFLIFFLQMINIDTTVFLSSLLNLEMLPVELESGRAGVTVILTPLYKKQIFGVEVRLKNILCWLQMIFHKFKYIWESYNIDESDVTTRTTK